MFQQTLSVTRGAIVSVLPRAAVVVVVIGPQELGEVHDAFGVFHHHSALGLRWSCLSLIL